MTSFPRLACPKCRRALGDESWIDAGRGRCHACELDFEFHSFRALHARPAPVAPRAVQAAENATCFFHAENQAETACESCGRFICGVCAVEFAGRKLCPSCVATVRTSDQGEVRSRVLYGGIALALALLPLLVWPFTVITAPAALVVVIMGWRKPPSLVNPGRGRLIVAGLAALLQIAVWIFIIAAAVLARRT